MSSFTRENLLSPEDVSQHTGIAVATLAAWRCAKRGPPYLKVGRKVWYPRDLFDNWMASRIQQTEAASTRLLPSHPEKRQTHKNERLRRHRTKRESKPAT